jgi:hypothetical protein
MTGLARWRLELAIILAILAAHHYGTQRIPDPWTTILILAAITGLIAWPRTRAAVTTGLWHARVRRAWTRAVIDTGAADPPPGRSRRPTSRYGPKAGRIHDVLAGEQLTVRIPRGDSVTTLEQRHDALAACLQVKEVRIAREGDNARYCRALLIRRDPFDRPRHPVPWPNQHAATTLSALGPDPHRHRRERRPRHHQQPHQRRPARHQRHPHRRSPRLRQKHVAVKP